MKKINLLEDKTEKEVIEIVKKLSVCPLTPSSHGYAEYNSISIGEASQKSIKKYNSKALTRPAVALLDVVLAANRNYNKVVEPKIKHILENSDISTFKQLEKFIKENTVEEFYKFWGHKDNKKYSVLKAILLAINELKKIYKIDDDYQLMNNWAKNVDYTKKKEDYIGKIDNIGVATFQHLRMVFGANTVKPDQRVVEVLEYEFGLNKINQLNAIKVVEDIAKITNKSALEIDQIFVKYGSGYYNRNDKKNNLPKNNHIANSIAKKLEYLNVGYEIILEATGIDLRNK